MIRINAVKQTKKQKTKAKELKALGNKTMAIKKRNASARSINPGL